MSTWVALFTFVFAVLVQSTAGVDPWLFSSHVDWLLVTVTAWAIVRGPDQVLVTAPPAAILAGLLGAGSMGTPLLTLIVPVGLAMLMRNGTRGDRLPALALTIMAATLWALVLDLVIDFLSGAHAIQLSGFGSVLAGTATLNLAAATLLYLPFRLGRKPRLREPTRVGLSYEIDG